MKMKRNGTSLSFSLPYVVVVVVVAASTLIVCSQQHECLVLLCIVLLRCFINLFRFTKKTTKINTDTVHPA